MMAEAEKRLIKIDDVEYDINEMTERQQNMLNHVADLDQKLAMARFNVDQLEVSRQAFFGMLKASLEEEV
jgi:hypothetical protein